MKHRIVYRSTEVILDRNVAKHYMIQFNMEGCKVKGDVKVQLQVLKPNQKVLLLLVLMVVCEYMSLLG